MARERPSLQAFLDRTQPVGPGAQQRARARALLGPVTPEDLADAGLRPEGVAAEPAVAVEVESDDSARRAGRRPFTARVRVSAAIAGLRADARTTNVSEGGVFIETTELLEVGDRIVLTFPNPDGGSVLVGGQVRWVTPFGTLQDPRPGMGVEFTGMDDAKRRRLAGVLGLGE
jgi:uncharacterized protein (TIGR02266 family)